MTAEYEDDCTVASGMDAGEAGNFGHSATLPGAMLMRAAGQTMQEVC